MKRYTLTIQVDDVNGDIYGTDFIMDELSQIPYFSCSLIDSSEEEVQDDEDE